MNSENQGANSAAPLMLVSMPQMNDPNFAKTVILLCDYTSDGAFGLVVNRQMTDPAWTLVKPETPVHVDPSVHLWIGGPVDQQRTWVLMSEAQGPEEDQREICPGVLLSASQALTLQLLQSPPTNKVRVIAGYSGWGAGQLEHELAESGWLTLPVDPQLIFGVPSEQMWETALSRIGAEPSSFQQSSGVH
jgi:putative transcriptional regulator